MRDELLHALQFNFPVATDPLGTLAAPLSADRDEVAALTRELLDEGVIRRIGPTFDARALGFTSTLVMVTAEEGRIDAVAEYMGGVVEVTHNYLRDHPRNLWFTVIARDEARQDAILNNVRSLLPEGGLQSLPSRKVFKISARFSALEGEKVPPYREPEMCELSDEETALARELEQGFDVLAEDPFARAGEAADLDADAVVEQVRAWLARGVLRRFGAVVRHMRVGFTDNGMCVFEVTSEGEEAVGAACAESPAVSHCYLRFPAPGWPYTLYAMAHGRSRDEVESFARDIASREDVKSHAVLYTVRELKKTSMKFFP